MSEPWLYPRSCSVSPACFVRWASVRASAAGYRESGSRVELQYRVCRRYGGFHEREGVASRAFRAAWRKPFLRGPSHDDLDQAVLARGLGGLHLYREATLDRFVDVLEQLFEGFALGRASGDSGHLRPVASLLRFVNNYFELHDEGYISTKSARLRCAGFFGRIVPLSRQQRNNRSHPIATRSGIMTQSKYGDVSVDI